MTVLNAVRKTPMINLDGVFVKLEYLNPSGSVKDRIARYVVEKAERAGKLKKGYTIVEATSGNTGIAFSLVAAVKGYRMTAVMPRGMSPARVKIMKSLGAKVVLVKKDCFSCAIEHAKKLGKGKNTYTPRQFENPWNVEEHEKNLGKEILEHLKVDAFVAGVGTGGTVIGAGRALKKADTGTKVFALEPDECHALADSGIGPVLNASKTKACRHHGIEGIGDGMVPEIIKQNKNVLDGVMTVKSKNAITEAKKLAKRGYFVGPSSGANFLAAKKLLKKYRNVVTLFPDSGDRYLD